MSSTALNWQGTDGDDVKCGSGYIDYINGLGGNDHLYGLGADDKLTGGTGNDMIGGTYGNDLIFPGDGADYVDGQGDDDTFLVSADGQQDQIYGGSGYDVVCVGTSLETVDYYEVELIVPRLQLPGRCP